MERQASSIRAERYRDLDGRSVEPWFRRAVLILLLALAVVALAGTFGQRPKHSRATAGAADLELSSPTRLRGGLYYQAKFTITAHRKLDSPRLVLRPGWLDGMTLNTTEPAPSEELNRDGRLVLDYQSLAAGERLAVFLEYQVNPTTTGTRRQTAELDDGETAIASISRSTTIFP